jgi:hypothetical protein
MRTKCRSGNVKRLFGSLRCRLEDNIEMEIKAISLEGMDYIHLAQYVI